MSRNMVSGLVASSQQGKKIKPKRLLALGLSLYLLDFLFVQFAFKVFLIGRRCICLADSLALFLYSFLSASWVQFIVPPWSFIAIFYRFSFIISMVFMFFFLSFTSKGSAFALADFDN